MIKGLLTIFLTLTFYTSFSQEKLALAFVNIEGNYSKLSREFGTPSNGQNTNTKALFIGSSVSFYKSSKISIGLGIDFSSIKETRESFVVIKGINSETTSVTENIFQVETMNIKSNALIYNIHLAYTKSLAKNLYFISTFKLNYGKINNSYTSILYSATEYEPLDNNNITLTPSSTIKTSNRKGSNNTDYFGLNICPELLYFISNHCGFFIKANGIAFTMYDWKKQNTSWLCNLSPSYWNLGITMKF